jgi:MFS family permease
MAFLVDRVGRRHMLLVGTPIMIVGLLWACITFVSELSVLAGREAG